MGIPGKMTTKGQTTVPKKVREALGLSSDTPVEWEIEGRVAKLRARTTRIEDFAGMLGKPPRGAGLKIDELDDAIADAVAEEFERSTR